MHIFLKAKEQQYAIRNKQYDFVAADPYSNSTVTKNSDCFQLCKPDILYILDRAHGLHFYSVCPMPAFGRDDLFGSLIERP